MAKRQTDDRNGTGRAKTVSLFGIDTDDALRAAMQVDPKAKAKPKKRKTAKHKK